VVRAAGWYEKEQPGFGIKFIAAAREAAARAVAHPEQGSPYLFGTRRVFLDGFPYSVIYAVGAQRITIIAVEHQRRRPGYWRRRLRSISDFDTEPQGRHEEP
jgi:plasmid stabilization system protein ParE